MGNAPMSTRSKLLILTAVMASLLEIIDTSIVNVAVPTMMGNLGATLDEISWVITGYIIANAIVLPIASWISGQLGRKFYYTSCILLFTGASVACGLSPNLPVLVVFRVIQGFAGGALLPTSQALIYEAFPKEKAGMASAIYGMSVMIGPTLGPTLGGYLTDNLGWRSIFNINLPLGIIVAVLSFLLVEDVGFDPGAPKAAPAGGEEGQKRKLFKKRENRQPVDGLGLLFLIVGVGCFQYVLERGHAEDWFDSRSITISAILAVVCIAGLIWWELRAPHPILQFKHFKNTSFRSGVMLMAALGAMLYSLIFMIPVFVSSIQGLTATQTGMLFIPGALFAAFAMPFIGMQLRKRDPRVLILLGFGMLDVAVLMISRFDSQTSVDQMFWPLLIRGVAMAFLFVPINTTVLSQFSGAAIGEAAGMLNLCRQLGGSMAIAGLSTLFQSYQDQAYDTLISHLTPLDMTADYARRLYESGLHAKQILQVGVPGAAVGAIKTLYFHVQREAFVLGFQKVLSHAAGMIVIVIIPLFFMKRPDKAPSPAAMDAH